LALLRLVKSGDSDLGHGPTPSSGSDFARDGYAAVRGGLVRNPSPPSPASGSTSRSASTSNSFYATSPGPAPPTADLIWETDGTEDGGRERLWCGRRGAEADHSSNTGIFGAEGWKLLVYSVGFQCSKCELTFYFFIASCLSFFFSVLGPRNCRSCRSFVGLLSFLGSPSPTPMPTYP
jgi:hypothetical protein